MCWPPWGDNLRPEVPTGGGHIPHEPESGTMTQAYAFIGSHSGKTRAAVRAFSIVQNTGSGKDLGAMNACAGCLAFEGKP